MSTSDTSYTWRWCNHLAEVNAYYAPKYEIDPKTCTAPVVPYIHPSGIQSKKKKKKKKKNTDVSNSGAPVRCPAAQVLKILHLAFMEIVEFHLNHTSGTGPKGQSDVQTKKKDQLFLAKSKKKRKSRKRRLSPEWWTWSNVSAECAWISTMDNQQLLLPPDSQFYHLEDVFTQLNVILQDQGGLMDCVLMDPPWPNQSVTRGNQYMTFSSTTSLLSVIPNLKRLMNPRGCLVLIWVTNNPQYLDFLVNDFFPQLGCQATSTWYWLKFAQNHELVVPLPLADSTDFHKLPYECLVVGYTTNRFSDLCPVAQQICQTTRVIASTPLRHSWKPPLDRDIQPIVKDGRKIEFFARECRPHWISVGNEVTKFQQVEYFSEA